MSYTPEQLAEHNIHIFLAHYKIKNERGLPITFKDHMFLWDIYKDMSPLQVLLKPPQIGATVMSLIKTLWVSKNKKRDIIYTLPTQSDVVDMAGGKVNRIIAQNPIFLDWVKEHDSVEQKTVGDNIVYWRGTWTTKAAMMVSSGLNIHDEVDASKAEVIIQYETRLQAEKGGMRWYFSHPSLVGSGVDKYWQISNKQEWFIKCSHCGKEQMLSWPESIEGDKYVCKGCHMELSDDDRRHGRWIGLNNGQPFVGYHISQLMCAWIPASKIQQDFKEKDAQYFTNYVLGLPYQDSQNKVTLDAIEKCLTSHNERKGRVVIGVDTGVDIRYVIGDLNGLFDYGEVKTYEDLIRIANRYKDWVMVIDQGGDIVGSRQLQETYPGQVFLCSFQKDRKNMQLIKWGEKDNFGWVYADRNRLIQLVVDEINATKLPIYGDIDKWWNYWLHYSHIFRTTEEDALGNLVYTWMRNDRDDWVLATAYWRIGIDKFGYNAASFVGEENKEIKEAPEISWKNTMPAPKIILPTNNSSDDWRYN